MKNRLSPVLSIGRRFGLLTQPWTVLAVALALRVAWALLVPVDPVSDSAVYGEFARSIARGRGYAFADGSVTVYWPVGTSAVYAALLSSFGTLYAPVVVLNVLLGVGIVALTHALGRRYFGASVGIGAAWLTAAWPLLIQFTTILASELLFVFLLLLSLYLWGSQRGNALLRQIGWSAAMCAAIYMRPTALPLLVLLPLCDLWTKRCMRAFATSVVAIAAVSTALFAPWVQRNYDAFGKFCLVSANFGVNLWMGNNPASSGGYMDVPATPFADEIERDRELKRQAIEFIRADPGKYLRLALKRFVMTHDRESIGVTWNEPGMIRGLGAPSVTPIKALSAAYWWGCAALAVAGMVTAWRLRRMGLFHPLFWIPAMFVVIPVLTVGQDRYHVPIDPFVAVFAGVFIERRLLAKNCLCPSTASV